MFIGTEHWLPNLTGIPQAFNPRCWQQCSSVCSWQQGSLHSGVMQACATLQRVTVLSLDQSNSLLAPAQVSVDHCLPCGFCCEGSMRHFTSNMRMPCRQSKCQCTTVSPDARAELCSLQQRQRQQGARTSTCGHVHLPGWHWTSPLLLS